MPPKSGAPPQMGVPVVAAAAAAAAAQSATPAPTPASAAEEARRLDAFRAVCQRLEITDEVASDLRVLEQYHVVLVADDSGSMSTGVGPAPPFGRRMTRWDELKQTVAAVAELATVFDPRGLDVYFLNKGQRKGLRSAAEVASVFETVVPSGFTPIRATLDRVLADQRGATDERRLLILIATDGAPTTSAGVNDVGGLRRWLVARDAKNLPVSFLAITDDDDDVKYLDDLDDTVPYVDCTDDYRSEAAQVLKASSRRLTRGDWVAKALIGPILAKYDGLDGGTNLTKGATAMRRRKKGFDGGALVVLVFVVAIVYVAWNALFGDGGGRRVPGRR